MRSLRVTLVTQSYHPVHGGIGEHARHLGLALQERGHRVRILTSGPAPRGGELCGLEVVRIGRRFHIPSNGARASLAFHPLYRKAVHRAIAAGVDLVHIHSPLEPFLPWAVLQEAGVPCIGTFHNAGAVPWGYRLFARWLDPLAQRLRLRTAVSRCAAAYAGRHFPGEYLLIPNGVDPGRFSPDGDRPRSRPPTLLFVGRLEPRKGLDVLVDGVARIGRRLPVPPRLVVIGDGSMRGSLLRRARAARIDLRWLGAVEHESLPGWYRAADLLVAPAVHGESFGIVLLEALASGLPVVASRIEGFREVLDGCPSARLFAPRDGQALAEALEESLGVLGDRGVRAAARMHALRYAWTRVAESTEEAYGEALGGSPATAGRVRFGPEKTTQGAQTRALTFAGR